MRALPQSTELGSAFLTEDNDADAVALVFEVGNRIVHVLDAGVAGHDGRSGAGGYGRTRGRRRLRGANRARRRSRRRQENAD